MPTIEQLTPMSLSATRHSQSILETAASRSTDTEGLIADLHNSTLASRNSGSQLPLQCHSRAHAVANHVAAALLARNNLSSGSPAPPSKNKVLPTNTQYNLEDHSMAGSFSGFNSPTRNNGSSKALINRVESSGLLFEMDS